MKNTDKKILVAMLAMFLLSPTYAMAENTKTQSLKSFFTKFVKHKKVNTKEITIDQAEKDVTNLQGGVSFSLEDCEKIVVKNSPVLKNYKYAQDIQKSSIGVAKSNYFPTITGGTGYNYAYTKYDGNKDDSINNNYYGLNLSVNQLIWDFGRTTAKINMSKYNYEAAGYEYILYMALGIYDVRFAYNEALAARANEDVQERIVKLNELNVKRTKAMYEVGLKSKIDVVNAQVYLTNAQIDLLEAQKNYQTALIDLNNKMYYVEAPEYTIKDTETFNFQKNYAVKNELDVAYNRTNYEESSSDYKMKDGAILKSSIEKNDILKNYTFKPMVLSLADAIKIAYDSRPDLKSLVLVEKAQEEAMKIIKKIYLPAINAAGGYSFAGYSDYHGNAVGAFAGVSLPAINAMSIKYQIEQGQSYLDIAKNNVDLTKKNIYFDVQRYYISMRQLEKQIPLMKQKVQQSLENFELADGRYAVGLANYVELQQAQTNYNNAQLDFVQIVFEYNNARYYLTRSMGVLGL